jgi:hypothetical protein
LERERGKDLLSREGILTIEFLEDTVDGAGAAGAGHGDGEFVGVGGRFLFGCHGSYE